MGVGWAVEVGIDSREDGYEAKNETIRGISWWGVDAYHDTTHDDDGLPGPKGKVFGKTCQDYHSFQKNYAEGAHIL